MMRRTAAVCRFLRLFLPGIVLLVCSGCIVQSLNPYFTKESLCSIPGIEGAWRLLDEKGRPQDSDPWVFRGNTITIKEPGLHTSLVKFSTFCVAGSYFLDTVAGEPGGDISRWWTMHVFPVHVVSRVDVRENRMVLTPIDNGWFESALKKGQVVLPHMRTKDEDAVLVTAVPEEWIDFLKKYAKDEKVFSEENSVRFLKVEGDRGEGK